MGTAETKTAIDGAEALLIFQLDLLFPFGKDETVASIRRSNVGPNWFHLCRCDFSFLFIICIIIKVKINWL